MALTIPINLNIENIAELNAQVAKMAGGAGGAGAGAAGRGAGTIGGFFGGSQGAGGATAKGLGQIAKQLPGAGVLGDMAGAFKSGGIIGVGMAGVAGILGFVKQIMESSKVFQGIAGSFFKIFGAMADMFLLPFLPLAMKGMQMLMQHLPKFQEWGQKTADWASQLFERISNEGFFTVIADTIDKAMAGFTQWFITTAIPALGKAIWTATKNAGKEAVTDPENAGKIAKILGFGMVGLGAVATATGVGAAAGVPLMLGGTALIAGGAGTEMVAGKMKGEQYSPVIKRGDQLGGIEGNVGSIMNSMEVSLGRNAERLANYATEFKQKEVGSGGVLARWDEDVIRGSIPNTWDSITGMYRDMDDELADEARNAELLRKRGWDPLAMGDFGLGKIGDELTDALSEMTLSDFVLDSSVADEVNNCFIIAGQCLEGKFTSIADLVEGGVQKLQMGLGGDILDLGAVDTLISKAKEMGGAVAVEAVELAGDIERMIHEIATGAPLTVDPKLVSERLKSLGIATQTNVHDVASSISNATAEVDRIVNSWGSAPGGGSMGIHATNPYSTWGGQFGGLGEEFDAATQRANDKYWAIKRFKQVKPVVRRVGGGGGWTPPAEEKEKIESGIHELPSGDPVSTPGASVLDVIDELRTRADPGIPSGDSWDDDDDSYYSEPTYGGEEEDDSSYTEPTIESGIHEVSSGGGGYTDTSGGWSGGGGPGGRGFQFGGYGGSSRRGGNSSYSIMNVSINSNASIQDILSDLSRVQHMDDASFFNSVT